MDNRTAVGQVHQLPRDYVPRILAVIAMYYAAAHIGYAFQFAGPVASVVWLPVGVGIAVLYLGGLQLWPGIVIGDLLVNNYSTLPVGAAIGQSFGNLCEVVVAAVLLGKLTRREAPLATVPDLAGVLVAIVAGTAGQRDDRVLVAVARWADQRRRARVGVAHMVARRRVRGRDRAAVGPRLVHALAAPWLRGRAIELTLLLGSSPR